jgi:hypothetical protein
MLAFAVAGGVIVGVKVQPWALRVVELTHTPHDVPQAVTAAEVL